MEQEKALTVLIVEDEPDMASMIEMLLERKFSATVETAEDCASAREKFKSGSFDIITLDYQLPDGNGLELLKEIRAMDDPPPVIMVTGHGDEQTVVNSIKLGANGYVVKDKRLSTLLSDAVNHALSEITLRKTEDARKESEKEKKTILESLSELVIYQDMEHRIIWANRAAEESVDAGSEELEGRLCFEVWHQRTGECPECPVAEALRTGLPCAGEQESPDGKCWDVRGYPSRNEYGVIEGAVEITIEITQRKRAEESLRESEEVYRTLVETSPDAIVMSDLEANITRVSRRALELYGCDDADELLGKKSFELIVPEDRERVMLFLLKTREEGVARNVEFSLLRKDGTSYAAEISASLIRDAKGNPRAFMAILRDITERKEVEKKSREAEEMYRTLTTTSPDAVSLTDPYGRITRVSDNFLEMHGYDSDDELIGSNIFDLISPEDRERVLSETLGHVEKGLIGQAECGLLRNDGTSFIGEIRIAAVWDADGTPQRIISIARDITERKRAEEKIRLLSTAMEQSSEGVATADLEGNLLFVNQAWARMHGYESAEELVGRHLSIFHNREQVENEVIPFNKMVIEKGFNGGEVGHVHRDGTPFPTLMESTLIKDRHGNAVGMSGVCKDITERKRVEEELERINIELEGYAHTISHDLKGPLSAIRLGVDMLDGSLEGVDTGDVGETSEIVAAIGRNAKNAHRRIEDLLALAESGQEPRETSPVDIKEVVEGILEEISREIKEKGIEVNLSPDLGTITASPTQIQQVFSNLIGNAITHNDSEDPIMRISHLGEREEGTHSYLVWDNGTGIPEDIINDIFLPFTKGEGGGNGVGLSIAQKLVKIYGGRIRAYNDSGACFEFTLRDL